MDGFANYATTYRAVVDGTPERRSFLFLQGPISTFFDRLGRALLARGHRVHRVNLHFGDQLFWHLPATHYRGRFADWRGFVGALMDRHEITDLVLHGDRRPYHLVAAEEARARGIAVIATDLGYVRPDWITLEYDGMTTYSRFPRDPEVIRALAAQLPEPDLESRFRTPFWMIAGLDIAYNLGLVFGRALYPHYRYHSICHPFTEYAGWLWSRGKRLLAGTATAAHKRRLEAAPGSYFLVPLQLATDYQLRAHSPFSDAREAVRAIIASFARSGSRRELAFVAHPLDNGLIDWQRLVSRLAREFGVAERVLALPGGTPPGLLHNAAGIVTINSTIGVTALQLGVPVKVLGNAVFDIRGLTSQAPIDAFWHDPAPPDAALVTAFLRALIGTTQVKGGYYEQSSQACAIAGMIERLEQRPYPLPRLTAADLAGRPPRAPSRTVVVAGVSNGIGLALARAHAAPGMRLCLIGADPVLLERAAEDCRHRGALVETFCPAPPVPRAIADFLGDIDRCAPIDGVVVQIEAGGEGMLGAAMSLIAALSDPMRRRRRGHLVLLSNAAGRSAAIPAATALRARKALLARAAVLRRRWRRDGVSVTAVVPSGMALHAADWLGRPGVAAVPTDAVGEAIQRGLGRRGADVAVPRAGIVLRRALCALPSWSRNALRAMVFEPSAEITADDAPLAGQSASGD